MGKNLSLISFYLKVKSISFKSIRSISRVSNSVFTYQKENGLSTLKIYTQTMSFPVSPKVMKTEKNPNLQNNRNKTKIQAPMNKLTDKKPLEGA